MGAAQVAVPSFLGGEWSRFAQGRWDRPDYRTALNVCLNAHPIEVGAWVRRPGTRHSLPTRGGAKGRVVRYDFKASSAYTVEFTDFYARFRVGNNLATTNDAVAVTAVSSAIPAEITTAAKTNWVSGNTVLLLPPGTLQPLLQNRLCIITVIDSTHFTLIDAITGNPIDGTTLTSSVVGMTVERILEVVTPYSGGSWAGLVPIQAETSMVLCGGAMSPQIMTAIPPAAGARYATFSIAGLIFNDGPYLDPPINGVQVIPGAVSGVIALTLTFATYVSTQAYAAGAFVLSSGVVYQSLVDQNVGNTPASSPSAWKATNSGAAINNGAGFGFGDIGRLVRLFSEPALWEAGSTYAAGAVVAYNPSSAPGAATYWSSLVGSNTGNIPGNDLTNWAVATNAALWTWGKITGLANGVTLIGTPIGSMTGNGGLAAATNGTANQSAANSAASPVHGSSGAVWVGINLNSATTVQSVVVFPSTDQGFVQYATTLHLTINLYGSNSPPSSSSDGTLLGTTGEFTGDSFIAATISSNNVTTSFQYVWLEMSWVNSDPINLYISQMEVFAAGTSSGAAVNVELFGPALLYTTNIITWRLGAYSNATGWPTCGTYQEGRLWLGGAIDNRFDASVSNGIIGVTVNMAPTDQTGAVGDANAISEVLNSNDVNPILWMIPDQQGVIMGTQAGEWLVSAPTPGSVSPSNIAGHRVTKIGGSTALPVRTEHTLVFVQRYGRKLMEYFADVFSGKFSAPNLAERAEHIARTGILELAYQQATTPIIWGRCGDGSLFGITYKRDALTTSQGPNMVGWHRHALGTGRVVESICTGPSIGGDLDSLTMVTNDPVTNVRHVEVMTDILDELSTLDQAWYIDDGCSPAYATGIAQAGAPYGGVQFTVGNYLDGKTVSVWAAGLDCGDYAVVNGALFVPFGDGISAGTGKGQFTETLVNSYAGNMPAAIGATYNSDGQIVRPMTPAETGARSGPALGMLRRLHRYAGQFVNLVSGALSIGTDFGHLWPILLKSNANVIPGPLAPFTGVYRDQVDDDYSVDGMLCWRVSRPYPVNIPSIEASIHTQDQ